MPSDSVSLDQMIAMYEAILIEQREKADTLGNGTEKLQELQNIAHHLILIKLLKELKELRKTAKSSVIFKQYTARMKPLRVNVASGNINELEFGVSDSFGGLMVEFEDSESYYVMAKDLVNAAYEYMKGKEADNG